MLIQIITCIYLYDMYISINDRNWTLMLKIPGLRCANVNNTANPNRPLCGQPEDWPCLPGLPFSNRKWKSHRGALTSGNTSSSRAWDVVRIAWLVHKMIGKESKDDKLRIFVIGIAQLCIVKLSVRVRIGSTMIPASEQSCSPVHLIYCMYTPAVVGISDSHR